MQYCLIADKLLLWPQNWHLKYCEICGIGMDYRSWYYIGAFLNSLGPCLSLLFISPLSSASLFSPYKVKVLPTHDASKVRCSGPGLNTTGVPASLPVEFTIDAKDAGEGLLAVQITVS